MCTCWEQHTQCQAHHGPQNEHYSADDWPRQSATRWRHARTGRQRESFFHGVAADLSPLEDSITPPPPPPDVVPYELTISQAVVERKLSQINVHKAPGPDGLPNWLLRDFSTHLVGPVCAIYNASVREGFVPSR